MVGGLISKFRISKLPLRGHSTNELPRKYILYRPTFVRVWKRNYVHTIIVSNTKLLQNPHRNEIEREEG